MSRTHNELGQVVVTAAPENPPGTPFTPITARYRVDDCRSLKQLVGWTSLVPDKFMQITIPGSANAIIDPTRSTPEVKIVTVNLDQGLPTGCFGQYSYGVKDLNFAQIP